jgi:transposase
MAYSKDFRERAIAFMDAGHTQKELREVFGIYPSEVFKWRKLLEETGSLEPRYKKERNSKINLKELEKALEEKPDAYLSELAIKFGCTKQAIFYALKRLKLTYKKRRLHTQKNQK